MHQNPQVYHSQFDEDRALSAIFHDKAYGTCVEVGANDGVTGSATLLFEKKGWRCLLVEPIPEFVEKIKATRKCDVCDCAASSEEKETTFFVAENAEALSTLNMTPEQRKVVSLEGGTVREIRVRQRTLDHILSEYGYKDIDFITIDVEGHELDVLKGFSLDVFKPRIVILEDNSNQADPTVLRHMAERGYVNFKRTGVNDWYARETDTGLFKPEDLTRLENERKRAKFKNGIIRKFARINPYLPDALKAKLGLVLDFLAKPIK